MQYLYILTYLDVMIHWKSFNALHSIKFIHLYCRYVQYKEIEGEEIEGVEWHTVRVFYVVLDCLFSNANKANIGKVMVYP